MQAKRKGLIRAAGISTHHVAAVLAAAAVPESDVIHPLINYAGIGIADGTREDMLAAIKTATSAGKGIYAMKALGGGNLLTRPEKAFDFVLSIPEIDAVAVGMSTVHEVAYNTLLFSGEKQLSGARPGAFILKNGAAAAGNAPKDAGPGRWPLKTARPGWTKTFVSSVVIAPLPALIFASR